ARGGGSVGMSHGHFVSGSHFPHGRFVRHFGKRPVFFAPYGWDWPYASYSEVPSAGYVNTTVVAYPTAMSSGRTSDCRWNEETFNAPSSAGGKRPVQVMTCR